MQNKYIYILSLVFFASCELKTETNEITSAEPEEMVAYVNSEEGGMIQTKVINNIRFEVQYRPVDYIISLESKNKALSEEEYNKRKEELGGMQYYSLRIKADDTNQDVLTYGINDQNEYFARDNYYAFEFKNDIALLEEDSLACGLYHYINSHGLSPHVEVLMAFHESGKNNERTLVIFDQIYKTGIIKFHFPAELFENIPKLEIAES